MTQEALKALIEDLRLNHEFCPTEVILKAADELERLAQRTWVGLTDDEIAQAIESINMLHGDYATEVAYAIEAKLKEKNT